MKISRILAGFSALAVVAAMAIPASAGNGAAIGYPETWQSGNAKDTLVTRFLIGNEEDGAMLENTEANWDTLFPVTTIRVTIQGDYFGEAGWDANGSIAINQNYWGWAQVDWNIGSSVYNYNDDGSIAEVNPEKNVNVANIYVTDNKYTIEIDGTGFCTAASIDPVTTGIFEFMRTARDTEDWDLTQDFLSLSVQSFNEDETKGWNVIGFEMLDANGNVVLGEGEVAMGDVYDPAAAVGGDSSSDDDSTGDASTGDASTGDSSTSDGSSPNTSGNKTPTSTSGNKTPTSTSSDKTADTGVAEGLALAGIALAGAAFVISKKK